MRIRDGILQRGQRTTVLGRRSEHPRDGWHLLHRIALHDGLLTHTAQVKGLMREHRQGVCRPQ
jgi:hypothetical protein